MGYQVLARKYRPQRFADVAGQEHVTRTLMNALTQGRIAHGYIFSGHRGIGKTTIARIVAQALNCRNEIGSEARPTPEPCGICDSCVEIRQGNAVDVIEIDAATNRGIDEIRELREAARYAPSRDRYKIYILDEAHQITEAAFNALLKTLEEPPAHVIFMMATTEPENIPQTIRSRCQHFSFHAVKFDDILTQLRMIAVQEDVEAEDAALALLAEAGDGSMRDALSIMDQAIASAPLENGRAVLSGAQIRDLMGSVPNAVFERLLEAVAAGQSAELMEQLNLLVNAGHSPSSLARQMVRYLRNALMAKLGGEQTELLQISGDERARAARTALLFTEEELTRNLQIVLRTFDDLNYRQEQRFHLELGLLKLVHAQRLLPLEELLSGAAAGSGTVRIAAPSAPRTAAPARPAPVAAPTTSAARPTPATPASISPFASSGSSWGSGTQPATPKPDTIPRPEPRAAVALPADTPGVGPLKVSEGMSASTAPSTTFASAAAASSGAGVTAVLEEEAPAEIASLSAASEPEATEAGLIEVIPVDEILAEEQPAETVAALLVATPAPASPAPAAGPASPANLDAIRHAIGTALVNDGHESAAQLLGSATWTLEATSLRIEVPGMGKKMLALTINAAAEKIIRNELQRAGAPARFMVIPGSGPAATGAAVTAAPVAGSIQEAALNNPLVQRAKEIFNAEVRSVIDLRQK
jgi:DNA polymerase-3 subunit gamma/tau